MSLICNEALWERLRAAEPKIREWKRWLHEHPELSKKEEKTSEYIVAQIKELGLEYEIVGDYGIIATLNSGKPGKTVLLRADMDALPVSESSDNLHGPKETVSQTVGVSHACGHDAHVSMTMGAMRVLCGLREELCGTVLFVFEQAEETGEEIYTMLAALEKYPIDTCYATHVYAGLDAGTISLCSISRHSSRSGVPLLPHSLPFWASVLWRAASVPSSLGWIRHWWLFLPLPAAAWQPLL